VSEGGRVSFLRLTNQQDTQLRKSSLTIKSYGTIAETKLAMGLILGCWLGKAGVAL
jgi:hypothetical protein